MKTSVKHIISTYNNTNKIDNKTQEEDNNQTSKVVQTVKKSFENITKKTLQTHPKENTVKSRIASYQELTKGEECVIGSGMCAKHKKKVIRVLKTKRMSVINKDGSLGWKQGETTILPGVPK